MLTQSLAKSIFAYLLGGYLLAMAILANILEYPYLGYGGGYDWRWWDIHEGGFVVAGVVSALCFFYSYSFLRIDSRLTRFELPSTAYLAALISIPDMHPLGLLYFFGGFAYYDDERLFGLIATLFFAFNIVQYTRIIRLLLRQS